MSKTLYQVFKNLAWPDLCQAALVCKAWREVRVVYSFCFCAETQIGTIVVMVASFPPALFQAAEDPTLWKDFPVLTRMTLVNFLGFIRTSRSVIWLFTRIFFPSSLDFNIKVLQSCTHIRSATAEGFQVDLPCCNKSNCKLHTSQPWPLLQEVLAFSVKDLEPRLKELVLYLSRCSRSTLDYTTWVDNFAAANKVANICIVSTPPETIDVSTHYLYHWGFSSPATDLEDLLKKTISGGKVHIEIVGDSTLRDIPNIFEILGNQNIQKYFLETDFKIKSLGNNLNTLNSCRGLILDDKVVSFDAEEIDVMNRMLAHIAMEPRPRGPEYINLSKVCSSSFVMPLITPIVVCKHSVTKASQVFVFKFSKWSRKPFCF